MATRQPATQIPCSMATMAVFRKQTAVQIHKHGKEMVDRERRHLVNRPHSRMETVHLVAVLVAAQVVQPMHSVAVEMPAHLQMQMLAQIHINNHTIHTSSQHSTTAMMV